MHFLKHLGRQGTGYIHPGGRAATALLIDALTLRPGHAVLEIGPGTGATLVRLGCGHDVDLFGVDVLPEMISAVQTRLRWAGQRCQARIVRATLARLPFADRSFDRVYSESALGFHDTMTIRASLREISRVLRPGGLFLANEAIWNSAADADAVARVNAACLDDFGLRQASAEAWYVEDWLREFDRCGLLVESAEVLEVLLAGYSGVSRATSDQPLRLRLYEWLQRLRNLGDAGRRRQQAGFRRLLARHAEHGGLIEARLFVLRKPADSSALPRPGD